MKIAKSVVVTHRDQVYQYDMTIGAGVLYCTPYGQPRRLTDEAIAAVRKTDRGWNVNNRVAPIGATIDALTRLGSGDDARETDDT